MSALGAVPLALIGLALVGAGWEWSPLAGIFCGYGAGLLTRFSVQVEPTRSHIPFKGDLKDDHS